MFAAQGGRNLNCIKSPSVILLVAGIGAFGSLLIASPHPPTLHTVLCWTRNIVKYCRLNWCLASWNLDEAEGRERIAQGGAQLMNLSFLWVCSLRCISYVGSLVPGQGEHSQYNLFLSQVLNGLFTPFAADSCKKHKRFWGLFLPAKSSWNRLMSSELAEGDRKARSDHITVWETKLQT